jgi:tellurite methyltransferase
MTETNCDFTDEQCRTFIEATAGRETPELIRQAVDLALQDCTNDAPCALELGCGAGDDAVYFALCGMRVTVVDVQPTAIEAARALANQHDLSDRITFVECSFADFTYSEQAVNLVNARFSIPFASRSDFADTWISIERSLVPGGVFTGQLFGPNDSFVHDPRRRSITCHTRAEVDALLGGWQVHHMEEVEKDGYTATGRAKHWHVFHILAQRPALGG